MVEKMLVATNVVVRALNVKKGVRPYLCCSLQESVRRQIAGPRHRASNVRRDTAGTIQPSIDRERVVLRGSSFMPSQIASTNSARDAS